MPLTVQTRRMEPDIVVLELAGKISMGNDCQQIEWTVNRLLGENKRKLIFDLSAVSHVDSTGIGIIVTVAGLMKEAGGEVRVAAANQHVEKLLSMTSVNQIVQLHPTIGAAASDF